MVEKRRGPEVDDETAEQTTPHKLDEGKTSVLSDLDGGVDEGRTRALNGDASPEEEGGRTIRGRAGRRTRHLSTTFTEGEVIAGRYTVRRFLAQGGMGEVYEVEDSELGEMVALKTVLPHVAEDATSMDRFRREILVARRVTHGNVCRIFDIGRHEADDEEGRGVTFLTMELLHGETLDARIARGRMGADEALSLAEQIAEGLTAAHATGIVHRDLKPANIFLVPDGEGQRVVVTDFGLARSGGAGGGQMDVTATGEVIGTPAYMAPEQVQGHESTTATDVYAFGLILYEMLTGARAFEGETAFQIALSRLQQAPTAPSKHIPEIDPVWESTILRCLERDPRDRYQTASDVIRALHGETVRLRRRPLRLSRWLAIGAAALLLTVVGVVLFRLGQGVPPSTSVVDAVPEVRRSAAVLGFDNVSGSAEHEWIAIAIGEVLTTELSAGNGLRTIPGETVARFLRDQGVDEIRSTLSEETLQGLRANLAVDYAVLGSYTMVPGGDDIRLDVRVQDATNGQVVAQRAETGSSTQILSLTQSLANGLRGDLELPADAQGDLAFAALPRGTAAARAYVEGVGRLRRFDPQGALKKLDEAADLAPDSAVVHMALANAWEELGYEGRALEAARRANELAEDLPQEQRLLVRARFAAADRRWLDAVDAYRTLWTFFPDNPAYGLSLAGAQVEAGQPKGARDTIEGLRKMPEPASRDPRIDLKEAAAARAEGRFQAQLEAAQRAEAAGRDLGAGQLVARALGQEVHALIQLGRLDDARRACEEARELWHVAGDEAGLAQSIHQLGVIAYNEQSFEEAEGLFRESLTIRERLGQARGVAECHNSIGGVRLALGDADGARAQFEKALQIYEDIENINEQARVLANLAVLQQRRGDLTGAIDHLQQARLLYQQIDNRAAEAQTLGNIGATYFARGDLDGARKAYESAVAIQRETEQAGLLAGSLFALADAVSYTHLTLPTN